MKIFEYIWMIAYVAIWWAAFWLPSRKRMFSVLVFMPAAICAFVIPMLVADTILRTPHIFFLFWSLTPFVVVAIEVLWWIKKKKPN